MSDIEDQAAERVAKAARINDEVYARLHQYDKEDFGVRTSNRDRKVKAPAKAKADG